MSAELVHGCGSCDAWVANRHSALYAADCDGCRARALARSPAAWRALQGQTDTEIREAIVRVFGDARYEEGRRLVWSWIKRLKTATERSS